MRKSVRRVPRSARRFGWHLCGLHVSDLNCNFNSRILPMCKNNAPRQTRILKRVFNSRILPMCKTNAPRQTTTPRKSSLNANASIPMSPSSFEARRRAARWRMPGMPRRARTANTRRRARCAYGPANSSADLSITARAGRHGRDSRAPRAGKSTREFSPVPSYPPRCSTNAISAITPPSPLRRDGCGRKTCEGPGRRFAHEANSGATGYG